MKTNMAPHFNLVNSSRGFIRDLLYQDYTYEPGNSSKIPLYIVIEFPEYTGPSLFTGPGQEKWVPVIPIERRSESSECKSSSRTGFPIVVAKADSVHGLQGMTVGSDKTIKRLIFKGWTKAPNLNGPPAKKWPERSG